MCEFALGLRAATSQQAKAPLDAPGPGSPGSSAARRGLSSSPHLPSLLSPSLLYLSVPWRRGAERPLLPTARFNLDFLAALASLGELTAELEGDLGPDGKKGPSQSALSSGFHKRTEARMQEAAALKLQVTPPPPASDRQPQRPHAPSPSPVAHQVEFRRRRKLQPQSHRSAGWHAAGASFPKPPSFPPPPARRPGPPPLPGLRRAGGGDGGARQSFSKSGGSLSFSKGGHAVRRALRPGGLAAAPRHPSGLQHPLQRPWLTSADLG